MTSQCSLFSVVLLVLAMMGTGSARSFTPPALPDVAPLVGPSYCCDKDADRIDDSFHLSQASIGGRAVVRGDGALAAMALDAEPVDVQLLFTEQITQQQIDDFLRLGGRITYIYRALSYGWSGRIGLDQVGALPQVLGPSLVLVARPRPARLQMDMATQDGSGSIGLEGWLRRQPLGFRWR